MITKDMATVKYMAMDVAANVNIEKKNRAPIISTKDMISMTITSKVMSRCKPQ